MTHGARYFGSLTARVVCKYGLLKSRCCFDSDGNDCMFPDMLASMRELCADI